MRHKHPRRQSPDNRLDWRDPNMPCLVPIRQEDGTTALEEFSPDDVQFWMKDQHKNNVEPHFHNDPTYNMKRKDK